MDYNKLALQLIKSMPMPSKAKNQNLGGSLHSQACVLMFIEHKEKVLPKEIADMLYISTARVANILNKLASDNLIVREIDPNDRRQIIVTLTEQGKKAAKEQQQKLVAKISHSLAQLGEHDAKEHVRIMGKIAEIHKNNSI